MTENTIAIIGCGRMGGFLAKKLSRGNSVLAYDIDTYKARRVSCRCKTYLATKEDLAKAEVVILALASEDVQEAIEQIEPSLHEEAILVNVATRLPNSQLLSKQVIISAKIIGHAIEMDSGEEPVVVVDGENLKAREKVVEIFEKIGSVIIGKEEMVSQVNGIAARQGILAALEIKEQLKDLNLPEPILTAAIRNVAAGTMKAFAIGDIGPFAQNLIEEYEAKK